jgi:hypothetical protein
MKAKKLAPKAISCCPPKADLRPERGQKAQLPPTSSVPIGQRKQLAGTSI